MIDTLTALTLNGYTYIKRHPQILMTVLLIVVIPIGFLFSGQKFLIVARENQEHLERERIGLLHDVFISLMKTAHYDPLVLQQEIERTALLNTDIRQFVIGKEEESGVSIVASLDVSTIGTFDENPDQYRRSNIDPAHSLLTQRIEHGTRFWEGYRLVLTESKDTYYIYTETSLARIDGLFADHIVTAYYWLFAILAIVLILVVRHVRLIDYAYLYRETKQANEMKDIFTNMVAHELRAPLTTMRGYASMIREQGDVPHEIKKSAQHIEDSSDRLLLIVNDLLDVARIHSGRLTIETKRCNVQAVLASVVDTMQGPAKEKNITLSRDGVKSDVYIMSDEKRLYQAFTNLVSNSIKYTKSGSIAVSIEERSDRVEVRVKDTGMGISAENQKHLFAPFFRVENTEMDGTVGTGLGMWITKQLIELMKGSIAVESIKGVGTHIVVTLPK